MSASDSRPASAAAAPPAAHARTAPGTWLFVLPWELHHPGGVNQVVLNLFDANERVLGGRSLLLVKSWEPPADPPRPGRERATVRLPLRMPWSSSRGLRTLLAFLMRLPGELRALGRLVADERVERVHVHYPSLDAIVWPLLRLLSRRRLQFVLSFHGVDLNAAAAEHGIARLLWALLLRAADDVVVCGDGLLRQMHEQFPGSSRRARVIDNGVDLHAVRSAAQAGVPAGAPSVYLCSLGTFEQKKGHDITLTAFDELAQRHPQLGLVIAGRGDDADTFAALEAQRCSLRAADRVLLLPDLDHAEAMRWLSGAAVFVLASRAEPFGIVVLEAGVFGIPVVATSVCGAVRRLQAGEEVLVVPPDNPAALSQAIERLLSEPALARHIGTALKQRVEAGFAWSRIVGRYLESDRAAD